MSCYSPGIILQVPVSIFLQYEMEVLQLILTLYAPCIILQCLEEPMRCTCLARHACTNVPTVWYSLIVLLMMAGGSSETCRASKNIEK